MKTAARGWVWVALFAGLFADIYAPVDDSAFGREVKSRVIVGLGISYAKATHGWYDLAPYDLFQVRLRILSDAGDFSPVLRGVYADLEFGFGNTLLTPKPWSLSLWNLFALHLGFSFRDGRQDKTLFPYFQLGVGYNGGSSRTEGAAVQYDETLFFQAKLGLEWLIGGFLAIGPGISLAQYPFAYELVLDPLWSVGFHIDLQFYFR
jgi:hypothetical protein